MEGFLRRECAALQVAALVPHCQELVAHYFGLLVTSLEGHLVSGDLGGGGHPWVLGGEVGARLGVWWRLVAPQCAGGDWGHLEVLGDSVAAGDTMGGWGHLWVLGGRGGHLRVMMGEGAGWGHFRVLR